MSERRPPGEPHAEDNAGAGPILDERRDGYWPEFLALLVALLGITLALVVTASYEPMDGELGVVVDATSDAVVFQAAANLDLVQHAQPRFAMFADGTRFSGFELDPPQPLSDMLAGLLRPPDPASGRVEGMPGLLVSLSDSVATITSLQVTRGCSVRLELWPQRWLRLEVGQGAEEACSFQAVLVPHDPSGRPRSALHLPLTPVRLSRDAVLTLPVRPWPVDLRGLPVASVGFTTEWRADSLTSAIRSAVLDLPEFGRRWSAYPGDRLLLDSIEGELELLHLGDSIRTVVKGVARSTRIPELEGRSLRPSMRDAAFASEGFVKGVGFVVGTLTLVAAVIQAVRS